MPGASTRSVCDADPAAKTPLLHAPESAVPACVCALQILVPSVSGTYDVTPSWQVAAEANGSFRLPSLFETYGRPNDPGGLPFDRNGSTTETLSFTDLRRFRASAVTMNERVSDLDNGGVHAFGVSLAWQIAPAISLRAWRMHFDDTTAPYEPLIRFGARPRPATVGSLWATYQNAAGFRLDAIYRSDLIDFTPDRHFDASLSGPLAPTLRWFAATERRHFSRSATLGIRISTP